MPSELVFQSRDLRAFFVGGHGSSVCVVTFASYTDAYTLERGGFGEAYLDRSGVDAVHVLSRTNDWYQYEELDEALGAVRARCSSYETVISYGSSMGGYAAIRFGAAAGASSAIAISPQYSIDPLEAPFELRWIEDGRRIAFIHEQARGKAVAHAYVFYDPHDRDREHVERIAQLTQVHAVRLPHAGHPAGDYLVQTGLLSGAVRAILEGRFDVQSLELQARCLRRQSGQYLVTLARRLPPRRVALKLTLARMAVASDPNHSGYRSYLGVVLNAAGHVGEADEAHRAALAISPESTLYVERYARFLLRRGRVDEAYALARGLEEAEGRGARTAQFVALSYFAAGRRGGADKLRHACRLAPWYCARMVRTCGLAAIHLGFRRAHLTAISPGLSDAILRRLSDEWQELRGADDRSYGRRSMEAAERASRPPSGFRRWTAWRPRRRGLLTRGPGVRKGQSG